VRLVFFTLSRVWRFFNFSFEELLPINLTLLLGVSTQIRGNYCFNRPMSLAMTLVFLVVALAVQMLFADSQFVYRCWSWFTMVELLASGVGCGVALGVIFVYSSSCTAHVS
jgi:membrane protein YdbS with pleckstrin-like domain